VTPAVAHFWQGFCAASGADRTASFYEAFHFDDNQASANELAALVLAGTKRATASLAWLYETPAHPAPVPGALSVVTDWGGKPLCVIETTAVDIVPFGQVTAEFAATEGEGDGSLDFWRRVHWDYFGRECARLGRERSAGMPVLCETFRVVYRP
jgi:uncharacterized protein YhfF